MSKKDDFQKNDAQEPWEQPIYETEGDDLGSRAQQRRAKNGNKMFLIILVALLAICIALVTGFWALLNHDEKNTPAPESTTTETMISSTTESTEETSSSSTEESTTESTTESSTTETSSSSSEEVPEESEEPTDNQAENNQAVNEENTQNEGNTTDNAGNQTDANQGTTGQGTANQGTTGEETGDQTQGQTQDNSQQTQTPSSDTIIVQAGDGPNQVAARAGISVETLYQLNGIDPNNYFLYPGQELRIR